MKIYLLMLSKKLTVACQDIKIAMAFKKSLAAPSIQYANHGI